jgi:iron complex outermembrane receptor protein
MKYLIKFALFLFGITFFNAQTYTVSGTVNDFHDKTALKNAKIQIGNFSAASDENGKFVFKNIKAGNYVLTANHADCETFTKKLSVNGNIEISIELESHITDIESVTIHGTHKNNGSLVVKTLDKTDISRNSTQNLGNVLSNISGVTTLKTGNNISKPVIHGLYGDRVPILNNGVRLADQEWGVEHAPNVDINNFEHIDVIKGASALKYGSDAIGGVVVMEPEIFPKKDTIKGSVNLSGISNGRGVALDLNTAQTWKNGWAIKTNGGYKKLGDLNTPNYNLMNTGLEMNSFGFTVQNNSFLQGISFDYYLINQTIGIYRGSDLGNLNDFYTALTSDIPIYQRNFSYSIENPKQEIQHHIAKISAFKRFENWGKVSVDYSFQYNHRKEYDVRRGELYNIPALDLELFTNQLNLNDFIEREKWSLESGIDLAYQYNYSTPETQAKRLVPNYSKYSAGIYSVYKYKFSNVWKAELGARFDESHYNVKMWYDESDWNNLYASEFPQFYVETDQNRIFTHPILNFQNLSFNAGLEFNPFQNVNVKFNYAKVGRNPNIAELFANGLHHSAAIIEVGDLRLKNEDGNQFNLNIDLKINALQGLNLSVNPYLFLTKNFITEVPISIQNTIRGVFPVWSYEQVDAKMFGMDFDADWKLTENLKYKGKFSYVYGQDLTNNQPLILMMPTNFSSSLEYDSDWKNWYLKVENQYVLHQSRFPIYNPTISIFENGVEVEKTLDLSTPPPSYILWNLQTGLDFSRHFSAGLNVTNIFNQNYKDYLNRLRYFSYEMGRNIILNVKYNF